MSTQKHPNHFSVLKVAVMKTFFQAPPNFSAWLDHIGIGEAF